MDLSFFIVILVVVELHGIVVGGIFEIIRCANAQESDDPPTWWKRALIHAQARKEARKLDEEQP